MMTLLTTKLRPSAGRIENRNDRSRQSVALRNSECTYSTPTISVCLSIVALSTVSSYLESLKLIEAEGVSTTIVSFEEQVRGRLAYLSRARTMAQQIDAYRRLREQLDGYRSILVLDFDDLLLRSISG